jgi:hypothetical protein
VNATLAMIEAFAPKDEIEAPHEGGVSRMSLTHPDSGDTEAGEGGRAIAPATSPRGSRPASGVGAAQPWWRRRRCPRTVRGQDRVSRVFANSMSRCSAEPSRVQTWGGNLSAVLIGTGGNGPGCLPASLRSLMAVARAEAVAGSTGHSGGAFGA